MQAADALQAATRVTSLPLQTALRRDGACANCPPQVCPAQPRAFSPPGKTEARRWACTWNQPRACETRRRKRHGARIAHRRCACVRDWAQAKTRCANCPPQVRVRARLGAGKNTVRELLGAAARACAAFSSYLSPFPVWLFPLKILFICRSCRDGHPIFFSERKWGKRTAMGRDSAPFEPPFQRPAADLPFPRAAGRLTRPFGPQTAG